MACIFYARNGLQILHGFERVPPQTSYVPDVEVLVWKNNSLQSQLWETEGSDKLLTLFTFVANQAQTSFKRRDGRSGRSFQQHLRDCEDRRRAKLKAVDSCKTLKVKNVEVCFLRALQKLPEHV